MADDIVARLRLSPVLIYSDQLGQSRIDYEACKKYVNEEGVKLMREAADEIERLRKEAFHLAANQCHAGYGGEYGHHRCAEIDRLTKERDEARWEVCGFHHLTGFLAGDYAISRGWDYFNDERKWPKFPPSVTDFKEFLKGQDQLWLDRVDRLTRERDEARRLWCVDIGELYSSSSLSLAKERGWDCFKENTP